MLNLKSPFIYLALSALAFTGCADNADKKQDDNDTPQKKSAAQTLTAQDVEKALDKAGFKKLETEDDAATISSENSLAGAPSPIAIVSNLPTDPTGVSANIYKTKNDAESAKAIGEQEGKEESYNPDAEVNIVCNVVLISYPDSAAIDGKDGTGESPEEHLEMISDAVSDLGSICS